MARTGSGKAAIKIKRTANSLKEVFIFILSGIDRYGYAEYKLGQRALQDHNALCFLNCYYGIAAAASVNF
jgi:hypothetical protein